MRRSSRQERPRPRASATSWPRSCAISEAPAPHRTAFGTAGIRGPLGDGPGRINRGVVAQAAGGLARWLKTRTPGASVIVAHDARHQSEVFARDVAEVLAGASIRARLLSGPVPTPVLAFAVGHLGATAGVMVTASHNPATDNGLKVFLDDTTQVAAPLDAEIETHIAEAVSASLPRSSRYERIDRSIVDAYLDAIALPPGGGANSLTVAYTPLHGVGAEVFLAAAARAGFPDIHVVTEQADPDPDFPTVPYPNPEEPGTLDRLLELSRRVGADVAIAHDPDADRCAVAVRAGTAVTVLTGDEIGILLADDLLRRGATRAFASSIVSSEMLGALAAAYGQRWVQTLTGFKWLGKVPDLAFAYEEALGYCVRPDVSRDKDGISAALSVMRRAAELREEGKTLLDRRDELFRDYGTHLTTQVSVRLPRLADVEAALQDLGAAPPGSLGTIPVLAVDDLSAGFRGLRPTPGIRFGLAGARVIVRPSGTEPKLKAYVEANDPVTLAAIAADLRESLSD